MLHLSRLQESTQFCPAKNPLLGGKKSVGNLLPKTICPKSHLYIFKGILKMISCTNATIGEGFKSKAGNIVLLNSLDL